MNRRAAGATVVALLVALSLGSVQLTLARLVDSASVAGNLSTTRLKPPTNLAGAGGTSVLLTWTPTDTGWATGYEVLRSATSGSGYGSIGSVTPSSVATTTDSPGTGTWYYVLSSVFHNWQSARSNEAAVVVAPTTVTTPVSGCTGNAPVTASAGDNNGFQTDPGAACAFDGSSATDVATGTDTTDSCTSTGKDRHDFWGYAFGLPGAPAAINGITVRPTAGMSNNGGTTRLCVQLSWNGGATWTAPQSVQLVGQALAGYVVGGTADTWGRAWTAADLGPSAFRLRVISSSTHPVKDIHLDAISVEVTYTP